MTPNYTLSIDTATRSQVIALLDGTSLRAHLQYEAKYDHGSSLLGAIDGIFQEQSAHPKSCALIVIGLGPGSFTGLRVGLATAKGLARAAGCPIVGVSSLAAIAYQTAQSQPGIPIWAAVDANRGEIFAGAYCRGEDGTLETLVPDQTWQPEALQTAIETSLQDAPRGVVVHQKLRRYKELLAFFSNSPNLATLTGPFALVHGASLALLGQAKLHAQESQGDDLHSLEPNYIRPSDAELNFGKPKKRLF